MSVDNFYKESVLKSVFWRKVALWTEYRLRTVHKVVYINQPFLRQDDLSHTPFDSLWFHPLREIISALTTMHFLKGSVKWKKRGGVSGINRCPFNSSTFPQIFYFFLKDPGPLNSKKRIWVLKQLFMWPDRIMWPPGSKIRYRSVFSRNRLDSGRCSPAIFASKLFVEQIPKDQR